jgi:putative ABC transport system permease protein
MAGFFSDVRFGLRALKANPSYLVLSVLCLSLGIGASTMTFTVINDALLRPLGALDAARLVAMGEVRQNAPNQWWPVSWPNLVDWRAAVGARAELGALRASSFDVGSEESGARAEGAYATGNLFAVLGVGPVVGRSLVAADDAPGGGPVVVLAETFWRQRYGGDPAIVGRALNIDGVRHTVVGVVPSLLDVGVPTAVRSARVWLPLRTDAQRAARGDRSLLVVGRLAADASIESVGAQLRSVASELAATHPEDAGWGVGVGPLGGSAIGGRAPSMLLLSMGAAALVLLIACANIANLTLAHAARRRHEFAIRTAIGAAPLRIARQLLAESVLVATAGALLGLGIARFGLDVLVRFYEADSLAPAVLPIDATSLAFTIAVTFLTTVLVGLFPAFEAARAATRAQIAESGFGAATARRDGLRRGLVVGQIAGALVLLVGAALLARSFMNLLAVDGGVATERVTSIRAEVEDTRGATPERVARYVDGMLTALAAVPGVEAAASINNMLPLRGGGARSGVSAPGSTAEPSTRPVIAYTGVTPGFFDTLGIPLLRGRSFEKNEQPGRVAVVNRTLANLFWPNEDPVGRQLTLDADPQRGPITVIGVSGDVLTWDSNGDKPLPTAYLDAESFNAYPVFFFVRTRGAQAVSGEAIGRALAPVGFRFKRVVVTPMRQVARDPFWRQQMFSLWFVAFGAVALTLAAVGVYGVLAYLISQRWHEIGIRMALGAGRRTVLLMVVRQGAAVVAVGTVVGLAGAFVLARTMRSLLFGVAPFDPALFVGAAVVLAVIAMTASVAPALRASRVDPNVLLKGRGARGA